ncbi:unnamed protein product, partial [Mesorhabditis belari]|uniref:Uncharacterized protein n=1 Tax=Mesorhabditis belari TaxID=2138241 RepID=A0AAF3F4F1_9BILA
MAKRTSSDNNIDSQSKKICYEILLSSDDDDDGLDGGYYTNLIDNFDRQHASSSFYSSQTGDGEVSQQNGKNQDAEVSILEETGEGAWPPRLSKNVVSKETVEKTLKEAADLRKENPENDTLNTLSVDDWKSFNVADNLHKMAEFDKKRLNRIKELEEKGLRQMTQIEKRDDLDALDFCNTNKADELKKLIDNLTKSDEKNVKKDEKVKEVDDLVLYDFLLINNVSNVGFDSVSILESDAVPLSWILEYAAEHLNVSKKSLQLRTKANLDGSSELRILSPSLTPVQAKLLASPAVNEILIEMGNVEREANEAESEEKLR